MRNAVRRARNRGVPDIEINDDLYFSAMAHSDKQISRQISTIVFSNAVVEQYHLSLHGLCFYSCTGFNFIQFYYLCKFQNIFNCNLRELR